MRKLLKIIQIIVTLFLFTSPLYSQIDSLEKGRTYAQAYSPNQFKTIFKKVQERPSYVEFIKQDAAYDTVTIGLMAHAKTKEILVDLSDFEVLGNAVTVNAADMILTDEAHEFDVRHEIEEGITTKWSLNNLALCDSPENDCELFDWVEIPARYVRYNDAGKSFAKDNRLKTSVALLKIRVNGENELIPVEYRFYTKITQTRSAINEIRVIPAVYKSIPQKVTTHLILEKEWVEIICPTKLNEYLISQIQLSLKGRRVYSGAINGEWTTETQAGLEYFQIKNELHVGQLDQNTVEQLGFNFLMLKDQPLSFR